MITAHFSIRCSSLVLQPCSAARPLFTATVRPGVYFDDARLDRMLWPRFALVAQWMREMASSGATALGGHIQRSRKRRARPRTGVSTTPQLRASGRVMHMHGGRGGLGGLSETLTRCGFCTFEALRMTSARRTTTSCCCRMCASTPAKLRCDGCTEAGWTLARNRLSVSSRCSEQ